MSKPFHARLARLAQELDAASRVAASEVGVSAGEGVRLVFDVLLDQVSRGSLGAPLPDEIRLTQDALSDARSGRITTTAIRSLGRLPTTDELGALYDAIGGVPDDAAPRNARRDAGRFLTPPSLARVIARKALAETGGLRCSYLDPAAGAGSILIQVLREARLACPREGALLLYGVDRDPIAVALARALLWLECADRTWDGSELRSRIRVGDALTSSADDWHRWYPAQWRSADGFGAVVTNPPWSRVQPRKSEFRAAWQGESEHLDAAWKRYKEEQRSYAQSLRSHPEYVAQGRGSGDLYKYFLERIHQLLAHQGVSSMLIPSGFLRSAGASNLRDLYLTSGQFRLLAEFINKKRIFPIHSMFRFVLAVYAKCGPSGVQDYRVGCLEPDDVDRHQSRIALSKRFLLSVSGIAVGLPEIRSSQDLDLLERLHESHRPLGEAHGPWRVRFSRELDMTLDKDKFIHVDDAEQRGFCPAPDGRWIDETDEVLLPLYEGRMVNQFNAAAKGYVSGTGRSAVWNGRPSGVPRPQYLVPEPIGRKILGGAGFRAGFCDVSGHANERTVLAALIPPNVVCGNKVPTARFEPADPRLDLMWLAVVNSFTFDWIMRRWVSTTLNFFYWWNLPFPRLEPGEPVFERLQAAAAELSGVEVRGRRARQTNRLSEPWDRAMRRAEIEAIVAKSFGLSATDYEYILDDFPLVDRTQPAAQRGECRITRDLCLLTYLASMGQEDPGLRRRVDLARSVGAVPFQPTEAEEPTRAPILALHPA